ncbi:MAG TPA: bifunctional glutamate N-acetyltransferase/amino-acid acetyltransferase ArgJ [Acidimicrobiales bacterium]|nr:bifunctional glutamate N-acetyltransferase/amino-acid acetyltransferase ArgJ [Acidimicrobiales bacterium]
MSVTAPRGFRAAGVACGLKASGGLDLSLVATEDGTPAAAAGVFTANLAPAAPVQVSRAHLAASGGHAAAVVLSSGNANAATGARGLSDAERMCALVAEGLGTDPSHVLVCSTGLIGIPLPIEVVASGVAPLVKALATGADGGATAAEAIMTTDIVRKEAVVVGDGFTVGAMAKGAAMLAPQLATMLAVLTTDADSSPAALAGALQQAVAGSFNRLSVDGCTSTNDTVIVLANGSSGQQVGEKELSEAMGEACSQLAQAMALDAEGATKVLRVMVTGAVSDAEAHRAARKVADSLLVKCSINGADPYWGRVVSELGSAEVAFDPDQVEVSYGGVVVCRRGVAVDHDAEALAVHMAGRWVDLECRLGLGPGAGAVLGTDLGYGYIDENRTTS